MRGWRPGCHAAALAASICPTVAHNPACGGGAVGHSACVDTKAIWNSCARSLRLLPCRSWECRGSSWQTKHLSVTSVSLILYLNFFFSTAAIQESSMITAPRYKRLTAYVLYLDEWTIKLQEKLPELCKDVSSVENWEALGKFAFWRSASSLEEMVVLLWRGGDIRPEGVKVT